MLGNLGLLLKTIRFNHRAPVAISISAAGVAALGVDAYAASTRMQTLMDQIELSYTLTARIQQMSLMNYL